MVRSHPTRHLVAIFACFSLLTLHSDDAIVYAQPRQLGYERNLELPAHEDTFTLERLSDLTAGDGGGGGISWEDEIEGSPGVRGGGGLQDAKALIRDSPNTFTSRNSNNLQNSNSNTNHLQTIGRPPPASYVPERYIMVPPEDNFLRELLLHSATPAETRGAGGATRGDLAIAGYSLPDTNADRLELKLPSVGSVRAADSEWKYQDNSPLYVKPKRMMYHQLPQHLQQKSQNAHSSHYMRESGAGGLTEPRVVSVKRWWGGYHRPRGQMDRRASQSKHYDCLKSCIKEGKLHPIQCHTLC